MIKTAYTLGARKALIKLGLMDGESKRNYYAAFDRKSSMKGEDATGNYDDTMALLRSAISDESFATFDRHLPANDDNRTDLTPSPPVTHSEHP